MTEPTDLREQVRHRYAAAATRSVHGEHDQSRALEVSYCDGPPVTTTDAHGRVAPGYLEEILHLADRRLRDDLQPALAP